MASPPVAFPSGLEWFWTAPNPWLLITAAFSGLGAVSAIHTFFQPKPYTAEQGKADRKQQNDSFDALDGRNDDRRDEVIEAISRDKHEQALADLIAGHADDRLKERYIKALGIERTDGTRVTEREAAEFALAAQNAALSDDPRIREISDLIDEGKIIEASDRKAEIAEETVATAARELRSAGQLALPISPSKALEHFKRSTDLDQTDLWSWIELGRLRAVYEGLDSAELCFQNALQRVVNDRDRSLLHTEFGDLLVARGELTQARYEYEAALNFDEALSEAIPDGIGWQRDLSVSYDRLGDVEVAAGNLEAARSRFEQALAIRETLATAEPGNAGWQRDLSVSYERLGDLAQLHTDPADTHFAREHYEAASEIRWSIARNNPDFGQFWAELAVPLMRRGATLTSIEDEEGLQKLTAELSELAEQWESRNFDPDPRMEPVFAVLAKIAQVESDAEPPNKDESDD